MDGAASCGSGAGGPTSPADGMIRFALAAPDAAEAHWSRLMASDGCIVDTANGFRELNDAEFDEAYTSFAVAFDAYFPADRVAREESDPFVQIPGAPSGMRAPRSQIEKMTAAGLSFVPTIGTGVAAARNDALAAVEVALPRHARLVALELVERSCGDYGEDADPVCPACHAPVDVTEAHLLARDPSHRLGDRDAFVAVVHATPVCERVFVEQSGLSLES